MPPKPDVEAGEGTPLLSEQTIKGMNKEEIGLKRGWNGNYNPNNLSSMKVFTYIWGTVAMDPRIWAVCGTLALVAFTIAGLLFLLMPDARKIDVGELGTLVKYLKVFLAFLLGMFMNNSLARWWVTVNAVTDYFNNVEKLIYCANSFGFTPQRRDEIMRFSVVSCYCLSTEVLTTWVKDEDDLEKHWRRAFDRLVHENYLKVDEAELLCQVRPADRAQATWSWVAAILYEMFEKTDPPIKPQAMNRMVLQCQVAQDMVTQLKVQICIQMPFMYVHMLAVLVHLNNLMVSVTCGLGMGATIGQIVHHVGAGETGKLMPATQSLMMTLVTLFVEPMLYQSFLQIGTNFCFPFGREKYHIPIQWMIADMVKNLNQMNYMTDAKNGRGTSGSQLKSSSKFGGFWKLSTKGSLVDA